MELGKREETISFVKGAKDGIRRRVWIHPLMTLVDPATKKVIHVSRPNPHLVMDNWEGREYLQQPAQDQVVCDVELSPGVIVQQVICRHRIVTVKL